MIELTPEQQQELHAGPEPRVIDPQTQKRYVLVSEEVYERVKALLGDDPQPRDAYPAVDRAFSEGWEDPKMDDYDRYEEFRP